MSNDDTISNPEEKSVMSEVAPVSTEKNAHAKRGRKPGQKGKAKVKNHGYLPGQPRGHRVIFTFKGAPGLKIFIAGSFNNWNPEEKVLEDAQGTGDYLCRCLLMPGKYEYKFVINGVWTMDPSNTKCVQNQMGTYNNVVEVQ